LRKLNTNTTTVLPQIVVLPPKHFRSVESVFILFTLYTQKFSNEGARFRKAF
jgi:hypothetical protein